MSTFSGQGQFYDHYNQINDYSWLNYKSLYFEKKLWEIGQIPVSDFGNVSCVETYKYHYFKGKSSICERFKKIGDYFLKYGTWPVPPIFLENFDGTLVFDSGFPCGKPYHLVEGHNRMAQFLGYKEIGGILGITHYVYIMKIRYEENEQIARSFI